ncbi:hypothetical protein HAX54_030966 [Datura stramonium]|uniref:Uncharacterized protein n=1 Tax=Datura stramonium TaxID=4076 RepID=A0ABS8V8G5_DATST|nr:hypothetical protein [Datura stramonium]
MPKWLMKGAIVREVEIEVRIKHARLEVEKNYQSTILTLNADLQHARAKIEQQQEELTEEKSNSYCIETTLKGQPHLVMTEGKKKVDLAASRQQQLREYEKKVQPKFDQERR